MPIYIRCKRSVIYIYQVWCVTAVTWKQESVRAGKERRKNVDIAFFINNKDRFWGSLWVSSSCSLAAVFRRGRARRRQHSAKQHSSLSSSPSASGIRMRALSAAAVCRCWLFPPDKPAGGSWGRVPVNRQLSATHYQPSNGGRPLSVSADRRQPPRVSHSILAEHC